MRNAFIALVFFACVSASSGSAAVVVLSNRTEKALSLELLSEKQTATIVLQPAETRAARVDSPMSLQSKDLATSYLLDPWGVYYLASDADKKVVVGQIELPIRDDLKSVDTTGNVAQNPSTVVVPVKIFVDEEEPTVQRAWEKRLRGRIAAASEILKTHCFVELKVVDVGTWDSDDKTTEFETSLAEFERETSPGEARLAIGFTSQFQLVRGRTHLGGIRGPLGHHLLIREWSKIITESERLEVLLHELGHFLGASHSPEANSVMRPVLGDRQARSKKFRIGFDPVNTLAMCLVSEQLTERARPQMAALDAPVQLQLKQLYAELAKTMPDDPAAQQFITVIDRSRTSSLITHTSAVVAALRLDAQRNATLAAPLRGDQLAERYLQVAAAIAATLPKDYQTSAFLLGIAVGLDRTDLLRGNPVAGLVCRAVESDQQRTARLAALGQPTLRNREDHLQHFVVSAALTMLAGSSAAEAVGLAKERRDAESGSGFSFADYQADLAGIAFAGAIMKGRLTLESVSHSAAGDVLLPETDGLAEGLTWADFTSRYGSLTDRRFQEVRSLILQRIQTLPVYANPMQATKSGEAK
jgi:hypothetical protein